MKILLILLITGCLNKNSNILKKDLYKDDTKKYTLKEVLNKLLKEYAEAKKEFNNRAKEEVGEKLRFILKSYTPSELGQYFIEDIQRVIGSKIPILNNRFFIVENTDNLRIDFKHNSWFEAVDFNKENIEALIELGVDINEINASGENLLHRACYECNVELVRYLIENNININQKENRLGFTPLFFAVKYGNIEILNLILKKVENIGEVDLENKTVFHHVMIALENCLIEKNEVLISNYHDITQCLMKLFFESKFGNKFKSNLVGYKKIINVKDIYHKHFYSYLNYFTSLLKIEIFSFEEFLVYHSNRFFEKEHLKTILEGRSIKDASNISSIDLDGIKIDLLKLLKTDDEIFVEYMLERCADRERKYIIYYIFNVIFNFRGDIGIPSKILNFCLENHFNLLKQVNSLLNFTSHSPLFSEDKIELGLSQLLFESIKRDDNKNFEKILNRITNINLSYRRFNSEIDIETTYLNEIIKLGRIWMFDLILKRSDFKIDFQDKLGYTAAHYAVEYSRLNMLESLLNKGTSMEITNYGNETPRDIALKKYNEEIINFLKLENELKKNEPTYYEKVIEEKSLSNLRYIEKIDKINESMSIERAEKQRENYKRIHPLHYYLKINDMKEFRNLLSFDNSDQYDYDNDLSLLELAVALKKIDFIKLILENGADPLKATVKKTTTLYGKFIETKGPASLNIAINMEGHGGLEILEILLKRVEDSDKVNLLIYCLENKKYSSFVTIFNTLSEINRYTNISKVIMAAIENKIEIYKVEFLLKKFNLLLNLNKNGGIFLEKAIKNIDKEYSIKIIDLLIYYDADINLNNSDNIPFISMIVNQNYIPMLIYLMENKKNINFNLIFKKNNLKYLENIDQLTFEYLLKNLSFNVNNLFIKFCSFGRLDLLDYLINLKVIKNFEKILISAIEEQNIEVIKNILSKKLMKINEVMEENGETLLTLAVKFNSLKVINFLLSQGELNVNIKNREGKTALLVSILDSFNCLERDLIIRKLLNSGADTSVRYGAGCNILMLAIMKCSISIVKEILNKDVKINDQNLFGETALMLLIKDLEIKLEEKLKVIKKLLEKEDIDLDIKDKRNNDVFKLSKELEESEFKIELMNLLEIRKRAKF